MGTILNLFSIGFVLLVVYTFFSLLFFIARKFLSVAGAVGLTKKSSDQNKNKKTDFVENRIVGQEKLTATERMQIYLRSFEHNTGFPEGLAFREDLKAVNLDYSLESLSRLDQLLIQIRARHPSYSDYLNRADCQHFMVLCAAYLSTTIARVTNMPIKWYEYQEAVSQLKPADFSERFETMLTCMIGDQFHMPLGVITEVLFDPNPTLSCQKTTERFLKSAKSILSIPQSSIHLAIKNSTLDDCWSDAVSAMGVLAAYTLFQVEGGSTLSPHLYLPKEGNLGTFMQLDGEHGLQRGFADLENGLENMPYLVLAYDGYANLPTGRIDAITLVVKSYDTNSIKLTICVPYRHANHPKGFAIYSPKLIESNKNVIHNPSIFKEFYTGIHSFKLQDNFWERYLDESI